jgi:hypothetical protein
MSKFYAVLAVIFFVFYFADRAKRRKARNTRDNKCVRCGALDPWEVMSATGAPLAANETLTCARCTRRDALVRTAAWIVVGLALAATVALLVLAQ